MTVTRFKAVGLPVGFYIAVAALLIGFSRPLVALMIFAWRSDLFSYIPLVPLISLGLLWLKPGQVKTKLAPNRGLAVPFLIAGIGVTLLAYAPRLCGRPGWQPQNFLCLIASGLVLLFAGLCCIFLSRRSMRDGAFPLAFLLLIAPFPIFLADAIEAFLQHSSAAAAYFLFELSGMPVFRGNDLDFLLPGMRLHVAPQCSGFHSTLALVITSLPAGYLFLRSPWKRAALTFAAIPLGIIRNGFRILVIGQLCVRVGPEMIDSYIHRTGGWIFFILFLAPFLTLLFLLARSERPAVIPALALQKA